MTPQYKNIAQLFDSLREQLDIPEGLCTSEVRKQLSQRFWLEDWLPPVQGQIIDDLWSRIDISAQEFREKIRNAIPLKLRKKDPQIKTCIGALHPFTDTVDELLRNAVTNAQRFGEIIIVKHNEAYNRSHHALTATGRHIYYVDTIANLHKQLRDRPEIQLSLRELRYFAIYDHNVSKEHVRALNLCFRSSNNIAQITFANSIDYKNLRYLEFRPAPPRGLTLNLPMNRLRRKLEQTCANARRINRLNLQMNDIVSGNIEDLKQRYCIGDINI